jgi:hypothetical protein
MVMITLAARLDRQTSVQTLQHGGEVHTYTHRVSALELYTSRFHALEVEEVESRVEWALTPRTTPRGVC